MPVVVRPMPICATKGTAGGRSGSGVQEMSGGIVWLCVCVCVCCTNERGRCALCKGMGPHTERMSVVSVVQRQGDAACRHPRVRVS